MAVVKENIFSSGVSVTHFKRRPLFFFSSFFIILTPGDGEAGAVFSGPVYLQFLLLYFCLAFKAPLLGLHRTGFLVSVTLHTL